MAKTLPSRFNPDLVGRDGTRFEVTVPIDRFERLRGILASPEGEVRASATFSRRKDHVVVAGRLRADWPLTCQRCLEPMTASIDEPYELVFVDSEAAARELPKALDPVVLDDTGQIRLVDLLEDELMLHVPAIPKHEDGARCVDAERSFGDVDAAVAEEAEGRKNPFAVLKDLKRPDGLH